MLVSLRYLGTPMTRPYSRFRILVKSVLPNPHREVTNNVLRFVYRSLQASVMPEKQLGFPHLPCVAAVLPTCHGTRVAEFRSSRAPPYPLCQFVAGSSGIKLQLRTGCQWGDRTLHFYPLFGKTARGPDARQEQRNHLWDAHRKRHFLFQRSRHGLKNIR